MRKFMIKLNIIIWIVVVSFFCDVVLAQSIVDLKINKKVFQINDELEINATIANPTKSTIYLQYLIMNLERKGPSISNTIKINSNTIETINVYKKINEDFRNGDYSILIRLIDELQNAVFYKDSLNFSVVDLAESFSFDIKTCKNETCIERSKLFLKNENIYLDYDSSVENPEIKAVLAYPDGTTKEINLPHSFEAEQKGTYNLEVTASKSGYKTITETYQFAVIEGETDIPEGFICNIDGVCSGREDYKNCPQDCPKPELPKAPKYDIWPIIGLIIFLIILVISIILVIGYLIYKRKQSTKPF